MESLEEQKQPILPEGYSYHPEGYIWNILPVEKFSELPASINLEGVSFGKKTEFHVTVANARRIAKEIGGDNPQRTVELENDLQKLLSKYIVENPILFDHFEDDLRLAVSSGRRSIAARCVVHNLEGFFEKITEIYGREFPLQPAHVSIYTQTGAAVGIDSVEQMESFEKIELPEVQRVLDSVTFP